MASPRIYPVILSGGAGERLWPASRSNWPKQFLPLVDGQTTMDATLARISNLGESTESIVVCGEAHRFLVAEAVRSANKAATILVEPFRRDSGPAIMAAAAFIADVDPEGIMLVVAADHVIGDEEAFRHAVETASRHAADGFVVCFGLPPSEPSTAFGYIKPNGALDPSETVFEIAEFREKPDEETAKIFVEQGYLWNSGNFVMRAATFIQQGREFAPTMTNPAVEAVEKAVRDHDFVRLDGGAFGECQSISIDHGLLEKCDRRAVVRTDLKWRDIGSWESVWQASNKDANGNATSGPVFTTAVSGSLIRTDRLPVGVADLEDIVVIAEPDAILVSSRSGTGHLKTLLASMRQDGISEADRHRRERRPWGSFETLFRTDGILVKQIIVKPGGSLSLQKHRHRSEVWVAVSGEPTATVDDVTVTLAPEETVRIPVGAVHRLENSGSEDAVVVEVQFGDILSEEDIIRLEDVYGRT